MRRNEIAKDLAVVMTVYNREDMVGNSIQSLSSQTMRPAKIIVVDDASTDHSGEFAKGEAPSLVELVTLPTNLGAGLAKRVGFQVARDMGFKYAMCLDSDDKYEPEAIELMTGRMIKDESDLVCCSVRNVYYDGDGNVANIRDVRKMDRTVDGGITGLSLILNCDIDIFANAKLMDIDLALDPPYSGLRFSEDTASMFWWLYKARRISIMDDLFYIYNHHDGQLTKDSRLSPEACVYTLEAIRELIEYGEVMSSRKGLTTIWLVTVDDLIKTLEPYMDKIKEPLISRAQRILGWYDRCFKDNGIMRVK